MTALSTESTPYVTADRATSGRRAGAPPLPAALRAGSLVWTWIGVLVAAAGFVLLAIAWGRVAGETQVYLQMPYVVSGAVVGLGVIMVGLTVLNMASRRQDSAARDRQFDELLAAIEDLQDALAGQESER